ncbi:MAG: aminotransferase class I/II-fold pyridoxal phosphate-dependent enzyme [Marinoscillum sp.]
MIKSADRLSHFSEYYFSAKLREIKQLQAAGRPVINLGIGSPDQMPDATVIRTLQEHASKEEVHGYQPYQGTPDLITAIKSFHKMNYQFNPEQLDVLPLMGSKEGITHISLAYLNPGDQVLIPSLGYPTYTSVTRMVGAEPVYYPLDETKNFEPDWSFFEQCDYAKVKLIWINYPHMPTGTRGSLEILERLVAYARKFKVLLCHDNPYSFISNEKPLSVFNVHGSEEVSIELGSMSKTFNMAGWRVGWAMGNPDLIKPVLQIKSNMDSGMFKPVQMAAVEALGLGKDWFEGLNQVYTQRRILACKILDKLGCTYASDQSGMFVWAKVPGGTGEAFCDQILQKHDVFITPGFIFGKASGDQFIRVSLCASVDIFEEVLNRLV